MSVNMRAWFNYLKFRKKKKTPVGCCCSRQGIHDFLLRKTFPSPEAYKRSPRENHLISTISYIHIQKTLVTIKPCPVPRSYLNSFYKHPGRRHDGIFSWVYLQIVLPLGSCMFLPCSYPGARPFTSYEGLVWACWLGVMVIIVGTGPITKSRCLRGGQGSLGQ